MSPKFSDRPRRIRRCAAAAALLLTGLQPASAVVGGSENSGPLARSSVMVLNSRGGVCSGVVVARDVVLTAAHCVAGQGEFRVHWRGEDGQPVLVEPASRALHPLYVSGAVAERRRSIDLALLRMPGDLPGRFGPVALAGGAPAKGEPVTLGGYGVAREGDARSTGTFRTAGLAVVEPYGRSTILLWASAGRGTGACEGDSGGPIANASGSVAAVTSWAAGERKGGCGTMSQGVLLGPQRGWIDRTLTAWGRAAEWR
ncbi:S1 family peptidase [Enterovirga aerilata]|uniref:S1 family peptidase n=1 Tax=Enterovirga aerilata TaxID=2730920 RepID=A0A849IFH4_9HYPH|nr:S1 family peptidase [Enterovirga sp. DB1703]NNM72653.1 S1 family peptidase [Enterovirga sp. DB1703]